MEDKEHEHRSGQSSKQTATRQLEKTTAVTAIILFVCALVVGDDWIFQMIIGRHLLCVLPNWFYL